MLCGQDASFCDLPCRGFEKELVKSRVLCAKKWLQKVLSGEE